MNAANFPVWMLQLRIWLARRGALAIIGVVLCVAAAGAWLWVIPQARIQRELAARPIAPRKAQAAIVVAPILSADQNLADFYDALGEKRYTEQQVKTLFAIAAKTGLILSSGQYKANYDQNGRIHTYQIVLPVRGSYSSVWQFCLETLAAIPFASLDEINFRRDSIADSTLEARLRFTLYLKDGTGQP